MNARRYEIGISDALSIGQTPASRARERPRRDVGGEDLDLPARIRREVVEQHHRERVRLLAGRASGAPDLQHAGPPLLPAGHDLPLEELELPRLAEEVRLVGADAVEHLDALLAIVLVDDAPVVRVEGREPEGAQALGEAADEQGLLGRSEVDPRFAQDEGLEERELALADRANALDRVEQR